MTTQHATNSIVDHTANKPWRDRALGYENVELTGDDGNRHLHCAEEVVWAAFDGWPPEGHRVGFLDGNPANRCLDNLTLLTPMEAEEADALASRQLGQQLDESAAIDLLTRWEFLEDENFEPLFPRRRSGTGVCR